MTKTTDLPQIIPIFPLPGAVLFPRARMPLHIFEPRYLAMIDDVMKSPHRLMGMVQPRDVPKGAEARLQSIGCAGRLTGFSETEDGRYMITVTGASRFRLGTEVEGFAPYRRFNVDFSSFGRDLGAEEQDQAFARGPFWALLKRYFKTMNLASDWQNMEEAEPELLINALSMLCPFPNEEKQALLEAPSLANRRETLVTLMEFSLHTGPTDDQMQ